MIKEGKTIPLDLTLLDEQGNSKAIRDIIAGHSHVVIYFYPKDNTAGCTKQACGFRDFNGEIEALGAKVIGISKDGKDSHAEFKQNHDLNFELYSDEDQKVQEAFGVWVEKNMFGNKYMGTKRSTFIVDSEGKVIKLWKQASPSKNAAEVYSFLAEKLV